MIIELSVNGSLSDDSFLFLVVDVDGPGVRLVSRIIRITLFFHVPNPLSVRLCGLLMLPGSAVSFRYLFVLCFVLSSKIQNVIPDPN